MNDIPGSIPPLSSDPTLPYASADPSAHALIAANLVPGFTIEAILGEGGMGVVYRAQQHRPSRLVALKVIRPAIVSPKSLYRFEREAEFLGKLQHPSIAAIFEMRTQQTALGVQPYFVMELIDGQPLLEYAVSKNLSVNQRLELLAQIADAVHYAHQKGIIHRDLKPSNILVATPISPNDSPLPKILDFGLAVSTDRDVALASIQTEVGALLGTLNYMAARANHGTPR